LKENHNKYYCIELHTAKVNGKEHIRIYTHYGRTDDLAAKADSGAKENRFYDKLADAEVRCFGYHPSQIIVQKGS